MPLDSVFIIALPPLTTRWTRRRRRGLREGNIYFVFGKYFQKVPIRMLPLCSCCASSRYLIPGTFPTALDNVNLKYGTLLAISNFLESAKTSILWTQLDSSLVDVWIVKNLSSKTRTRWIVIEMQNITCVVVTTQTSATSERRTIPPKFRISSTENEIWAKVQETCSRLSWDRACIHVHRDCQI